MSDLTKDYPAHTFRHSVLGLYLAVAMVVVILQQLLTSAVAKLAYFVGCMHENISPVISLIILATLVTLTFRVVPRMGFDVPVLTISAEGLLIPATKQRTIPWTSIEKVSLESTGQYRLSKWLVATPKEGLIPEIQALFSKSGLPQSGSPDLYIALGILEGTTSPKLLSLVQQYHVAFGDRQDRGAPSGNSGIRSSAWTGIEG